jgi:hypothetical protein
VVNGSGVAQTNATVVAIPDTATAEMTGCNERSQPITTNAAGVYSVNLPWGRWTLCAERPVGGGGNRHANAIISGARTTFNNTPTGSTSVAQDSVTAPYTATVTNTSTSGGC